jgi:DNA-binding response OmpR family regulator
MTATQVVLIEAQDSEARLVALAYKVVGFDVDVHHFRGARDAMEYLSGAAEGPHLLMVGLNLPDTSGLDIVHFVRNHHRLHDLPVVMLTGSSAESHLTAALEAGASWFVTKTADLDLLYAQIHTLADQFLTSRKRTTTRPRRRWTRMAA